MIIYRLTIEDPIYVDPISAYFMHWNDAKTTYDSTYRNMYFKPKYEICKVEVLERETHL